MSFKTFDIGAPLSGRLGEALGTGLKSGYENLQKRLLEREKQQGKAVTPEQAAQLTQTLTQQGMDPRLAQLYPYLTTGGQTKAAEFGVENIMRKESSSPLGSFQDETGLTPKEKIARQKERYTTGLKIYQEGMQKLRGLEANSDRFEILNKLNKSNKLPENLGRINVDKRGNLKVPFISTPEAERYIKTLNEFTANAKDTYGSRVTNFELDQYLKRFPTLLNSQEG